MIALWLSMDRDADFCGPRQGQGGHPACLCVHNAPCAPDVLHVAPVQMCLGLKHVHDRKILHR